MTYTRRSIVQAGAIICAGSMIPIPVFAGTEKRNRTLILVEFNGGNDGLNTVIPFTDKAYYDARPTIAIGRKHQLPISSNQALHPSLKPLLPMLEQGDISIINGLGYDQPNRSHFRSIEIWDTASESDEFLTEGWLGRLPESSNPVIADAMVLGRNALPVMSQGNQLLVIDSIEKFKKQARNVNSVSVDSKQHTALEHIARTQNDTRAIAEQLQASIQKQKIQLPVFNGGQFGKQLRDAATILLTGHHIPVIKVSIGSFDTHQNQLPVHAQLLTNFAQGLSSFQSVLAEAGIWDQVLVMTYSEFGRRVSENGSAGTDHGTAAPHFVLGGKVKGGIYGTQPALENLNQGDLQYSTHFKAYYQTVLSKWFGSPTELSREQLAFL